MAKSKKTVLSLDQEKEASPYVLDLREIALKKQEERIETTYQQEQQRIEANLQEIQTTPLISASESQHLEETIEYDPLLDILHGKKDPEIVENLMPFDQAEITSVETTEDAIVMYPFNPIRDAYIDTKKYFRMAAVWALPNYHPTVSSLKAKYRKEVSKKAGVQAFIVFLVLIIPLFSIHYFNALVNTQEQVKSQVQSAVDSAMVAKDKAKSFEIKEVIPHLEGTYQHIVAASSQVPELNPFVSGLIAYIPYYGPKYISSVSLLKGSEDVTKAAQYIASGIGSMQEESQIPLTDKLQIASDEFKLASQHLQEAQDAFAKVDVNTLPEEYQSQASQLLAAIPKLEQGLDTYRNYTEVLIPLLGSDYFKRYLVIFENSNELRPTGGFMGSFALVDIDRGEIKNIEIPQGGTYDVKGGLTTLLKSPEELRLVNNAWQMQDANWFFDFPESAKKTMWFYEKSGGPTVDGVLVITSKAAAQLVGYFGSIEMPEYNKVVTKNNFEYLLQKEVEFEHVDESKPKKIIADLVPKLIDKIFALEIKELPKMTQLLLNQLQEKQILLYTNHEEAQEHIQALNWGGHIPSYEKDYVGIVHTNVAGGKTDGVIENDVQMQVSINEQGKIVNTLTIKRTHNGDPEDIFTGVKNIDYMRVYVPKGSKLIESSGFKKPAESLFIDYEETHQMDADLEKMFGDYTYDENGTKVVNHPKATIFGNWLQTDVGETSIASFTYELPFTIEYVQEEGGYLASYSQYVQKQAGIESFTYEMSLKLPQNTDIVWSHPNQFTELEDKQWIYKDELTKDTLFGVVLNQ